ncbi:4Fe-4S binding protein [Lewinella lacunae]|uniref:4Fe-4S binding protein n=2 Tax=Neolewinella lacunae TaxID=1517758 RepID=A0A923PKL0_9BACT|nr:4Fe-4S binding protein [Neolewinella lacunae]
MHQRALTTAGERTGLFENTYGTTFAAEKALKETFYLARTLVDQELQANGLPEGKQQWEVELPEWQFKSQRTGWIQGAADGPVTNNPWLFFFLTIGLGALGGILYVLPKFAAQPGIKNDHIFHSQLTKGLDLGWRAFFLTVTILGVLGYGFWYMDDKFFWPAVTALIAIVIIGLVLFAQQSWKQEARDAGPEGISGYLGIFTGVYFIGFYLLLYWASHHIVAWIQMVSPVSEALYQFFSGEDEGGAASQWFLYGLMYTLIILVMGVRMIAKYRHNKYQIFRTISVMFFQTAFAFMIPEILVALNKPWYDFKNIWPLDYDFFFGWQLDQFQSAGALGLFMLFWGIALIILGVPLMVHFLGKRWYCSWVCGCGGLAETMGDPWRQLSDKSLRAWKFERWIIHGVLVAAIVMTGLTLYTYFGGASEVLGIQTGGIQKWYGFLIGAGFAGVVGTGFYPLMGNRVWCRFGCPLAAYLGLVQRFQSRFRITTNGGQCISCGNCSTYCEMGIDVRHYAQRGQDIVRASCVGCGVCAAVCPRGVLRLENAPEDISQRAVAERVIHIDAEKGISLMN